MGSKQLKYVSIYNMFNDANKIIEPKPDYVYPKNIRDNVKLLSAKKNDDVYIFGSMMYRIQKYPGDIDIMEEFKCCSSKYELVKKFAISLKKVINKVLKTKNHYFSEAKIGEDFRYLIDIGKPKDGIYNVPSNVLPKLEILFKEGLIKQKDLNTIKKIILKGNQLNANDYGIIHNIIRKYLVPRWSAQDILDGKKKLIKKVMTLEEAIDTRKMSKIDVITNLNNKYVEVTNIYFLSYLDPSSNDYVMFSEFNILEDALKKEIEKLYYSDIFYSPFKMMKRIFALCRYYIINRKIYYEKYIKSTKLINIIKIFISSNTSLEYQIMSELKSIIIVIEKTKYFIKGITESLDGILFRLSSDTNINSDELYEISVLIKIINLTKLKHNKIKTIEKILNILKCIINRNTIKFLNDNYINPVPSFLLPEYRTYDRSLVRRENDNPINPLEIVGAGIYDTNELDEDIEITNERYYKSLQDNISTMFL